MSQLAFAAHCSFASNSEYLPASSNSTPLILPFYHCTSPAIAPSPLINQSAYQDLPSSSLEHLAYPIPFNLITPHSIIIPLIDIRFLEQINSSSHPPSPFGSPPPLYPPPSFLLLPFSTPSFPTKSSPIPPPSSHPQSAPYIVPERHQDPPIFSSSLLTGV